MPLYLNKLEFSFTLGFFVQSLLQIGLVDSEKNIFNCVFAILLLSPLGKWCFPSFEKCMPFTIYLLRWIKPVVLKKKSNRLKVYRHTDRRWTTSDQKSILELSAQMRLIQDKQRTDDWMYIIPRPVQKYFTHIKTSPLPVRDCKGVRRISCSDTTGADPGIFQRGEIGGMKRRRGWGEYFLVYTRYQHV